MNVLEKAIAFAAEAHAGKIRKGSGLPYILHPIEVSVIISAMSQDLELMAAGALHDVPEDTRITLEEIRKNFGDNVARLVQANTEDKRRDLPADVTWRQRKQETVDFVWTTPRRDEKILILSDKLSNLRGMYRDLQTVKPLEYWARFNQSDVKEHRWYHSEIMLATRELGGYSEWLEYRSLIEKVFA